MLQRRVFIERWNSSNGQEDPNQFINLKAGKPTVLFNVDSDQEDDELKKDLP